MMPLLAAILMHTTASASTGGNTAGPGGVVQTSSAYSSVHVANVETNGQGTSTIDIETDTGGTPQVEHVVEPYTGGTNMQITVATSSSTGSSSARVQVHVEASGTSNNTNPVVQEVTNNASKASVATTTPAQATSSSVATTTPTPSSTAPAAFISRITASIFGSLSHFFGHLFGFFK